MKQKYQQKKKQGGGKQQQQDGGGAVERTAGEDAVEMEGKMQGMTVREEQGKTPVSLDVLNLKGASGKYEWQEHSNWIG